MNSNSRVKRHQNIRHKVSGTSERPRLSVYRTLKHLYVQLIDDTAQKTLIGLSDKGLTAETKGLERAQALGSELALRAKQMKITSVVFDRGGWRYHGQIKQIAETLRQNGITI